MNKLTKEQMQDALRKVTLNCTEEEIRFVFHLFSFDLKEFKQETGRISFEIHYKINYIVKVELTATAMTFSNEWINFEDENTHGIAMTVPTCLGELMVMFINMFMPNLLQRVCYNIAYNEQWSIFESVEEAQEYLGNSQMTIAEIVKPHNEKQE